jgi:chemotaxis signal transduction protein
VTSDDSMSREIGQVRGIVFRLDDGVFFVDIMRVREIIRPPELGWLVSMPTFVAGVMTLRGAVVPVLNLRERFELPGATPGAVTAALPARAPPPGSPDCAAWRRRNR